MFTDSGDVAILFKVLQHPRFLYCLNLLESFGISKDYCRTFIVGVDIIFFKYVFRDLMDGLVFFRNEVSLDMTIKIEHVDPLRVIFRVLN